MNPESADQLLEEWKSVAPPEQDLFHYITWKVRDIPYGFIDSREGAQVLRQNRGTCSGKHNLLKALYIAMGLETKSMIALHRFNDLPATYSPELLEVLRNTEIPDPHSFLRVKLANEWMDVDITWDNPLAAIGLEINSDWDGKSNMRSAVVPLEIIEPDDPTEVKEEFLEKLPRGIRRSREKFIQSFCEYLDQVRRQA